MKIVYDYKIFWSQKIGGISRYFVNLFNEFDTINNIDYKVIAPLHKNYYLNNFTNKSKVFGKYVRKVYPKTSFLIKKFNEFSTNKFASFYKPDLTHTTYYNENFKLKNIPLVTTVYDLIHEKSNKKLEYNELYKKKVIQKSDHLICISNKTKNDLMNIYNLKGDNISVIYLGANHLNEITTTFKLNRDKPYLLFVGSRKKYKNFGMLLKCLSISDIIKNNFDLVLFGGGYLDNNEKKLIYDLNLLPLKIYQYHGGDIELKSLYEGSSLFILPSLDEGFGLPLLEAMSVGCPVICSNIKIFLEIANNGAEFFNPKSVEDFKYKLEKLLTSNSQLNKLKLLGLQRSKNFTWRKCAVSTLEVYKNLLNKV